MLCILPNLERVSRWLQRPRQLLNEPGQDTRTRECIIRIDPDAKNPLMIGQGMSVRINLGEKPQ